MDLSDQRNSSMWADCRLGFRNVPILLPSSNLSRKSDYGSLPKSSSPSSSNTTSTEDTTNREGEDGMLPDVEALLSNAMVQLSVGDRDRALDEIHGVPDMMEETEEWMNMLLQQLDVALQRKKEDRQAGAESYILAELQNRAYVSNRAFRMKFLRAEEYDPTAAAQRMLRFFTLKRDAFGYDLLTSTITLNDLQEDAIEILRSGAYQVSPVPDRSGRLILVVYPRLRPFKTDQSKRIQAIIYLLMSLVESETVQRHGIVVVLYFDGMKNEGKQNPADYFYALPFRLASLHCCFVDDNLFFPTQLLKLGLRAVQKTIRARFRIHRGTPMECLYALTPFGIPRGALSVPLDGNTGHNVDQEAWLQNRAQIESPRSAPRSTNDKDSVLATKMTSGTSDSLVRLGISDNDVLFGKGRAAFDHVGTIRFRRMIDRYMINYETSPRAEKTLISERVVQMIKESHGRFLKFDTVAGEWQEVSHVDAREKTSHTFRNRKRNQQKVQSPLSSAITAGATFQAERL